jgi:hypothetical protein
MWWYARRLTGFYRQDLIEWPMNSLSTIRGAMTRTKKYVSVPAGDITSNLLIFYKMVPGDIVSTTLTDYSGSGYHGTIAGGATIGAVGGCTASATSLTLTSASNQWVVFPAFVLPSADMTIASWINIKTATNAYAIQFAKFPTGTDYFYCSVKTDYVHDQRNGGTIGTYFPKSNNYTPTNGFHHFVWSFSAAGTLKTWLDNVELDAPGSGFTKLSTAGVNYFNSANTTYIGKQGVGSGLSNFDITDYRIYNRALTAVDVNTLYSNVNT